MANGSVNAPGASAADLKKVQNEAAAGLKKTNEAVKKISSVPACSAKDNGKFLRVAEGKAAWETVPDAEGGEF